MKTKLVSLSLCAVLTAGSLAGCGKSSSPENSGVAAKSEAPKDDITTKQIELTVTSRAGLTTDQFDQFYGKYLKQKFPNWTFKFIQQRGSKILTQDLVAGGTTIDFMFESLSSLVEGVINPGLTYDMTDMLKKDKVDLNRFEPVTLDAMKAMANGQLWGLPGSMQIMVNTYNKDIFDKFGVPYPKDGMTWDDAFDVAKKISRTQEGTSYLGLIASTSHVLKLSPFSLPYIDMKTGKSTLGDSNWKTILSTIIGAEAKEPGMAEYVAANKKEPGLDQFIKDKNIGMYVFFTDTLFFQGIENMNVDIVSAPTFKEKPGLGSQTYPNYIVMSGNSKQKDASIMVIEYLTSDEFQKTLSKAGTISALKNPDVQKALGADNPKKYNWNAVYYTKFAPTPPKTKDEAIGEKAVTDQIPAYLKGEIDVNTLLIKAQDAADKSVALNSK